MPYDRITIEVTGFSQNEAITGIPVLLAELRERPWLEHPKALWDETAECIRLQIDRDQEDGDQNGQGTLDEVWDCVIATITFSSARVAFSLVSLEALDGSQDGTRTGAG